LKDSLIAVSPFGYGEICYRDFEIILSGALLFKASMDHLVTYPDIYRDQETYVSFLWDFSDFEEKVEYLINRADLAREISMKAQETYMHNFTENGREDFCLRFKGLIES
jgi:hypothetical protein